MAPTFDKVDVNERLGRAFLQCGDVVGGFSFKSTSAPDIDAYTKVIKNASNTAPGVDGLPYAVWAADVNSSAETLLSVDDAMRWGAAPFIRFNTVILTFAPKGDDPNDAVEVLRHPGDLRPIALKCTSNNCIGGAWHRMLRPAMRLLITFNQKAFVPGNSIEQNVIALDAELRATSSSAPSTSYPILVAFDVKAAFPSLVHQWILCVLKHTSASKAMLVVVLGLYDMVFAYALVAGHTSAMAKVGRGILQGDPLSGDIFVISTQPFFVALDKAIDQNQFGVLDGVPMILGLYFEPLFTYVLSREYWI